MKHHPSRRDIRRRFVYTVIFGVALAATLTPVHAAGLREPAPAGAPANARASAAPTTRLITDALGREVRVSADPQRIVTAGRAVVMAAGALYMFPGVSSRIVGIGRIEQGAGNFLAAIAPDYGSKAVVERAVSAEQLAALRPDVVILKSFLKQELGDAVERLGIPVLYVDLETPDQFYRDITMLGQLLNHEARAEAVVRHYLEAVAAVKDAVADIAPAARPRTLLLQYSVTGGARAFGVPPADWLQTELVVMAGGNPLWVDGQQGGRWRNVTVEQIAAWDPDHIVIVSYRDDPAAVRDSLLDAPVWRDLRAARVGAVHAMPADFYSWDQPDARWILGLEWLAARLHPTRFASFDGRAAVTAFFSFAYGMDEAAVERVIVPLLRGDID